MSAAVALPPAPWAVVMRSSRNLWRFARAVSMIPRIFSSRAATSAALDNFALPGEPAVVVVGGAGALARDHARADRALRRARRAEHLALERLDDALEDLAALARLRVGDADVGDRVAALGVEVGVRLD